MEKSNEENSKDIAAQSNLVATAEDFIPRSKSGQNQQFLDFNPVDTVNNQLHHVGLGEASNYINGSGSHVMNDECAAGIWAQPAINEREEAGGWNNYFQEPHSSNWRGHLDSAITNDMNNSFMRPDVFWENKGQNYETSNKSSYMWNKADKRIFPNYEDPTGYEDHGRYEGHWREESHSRYEGHNRYEDQSKYEGQWRDEDQGRYEVHWRDEGHNRHESHRKHEDHNKHEPHWRDVNDRRYEDRRRNQDQKRNGDDRRYEDRRRIGDDRKYEENKKYGGDRKNEESRKNGGDGKNEVRRKNGEDRKYEDHRRNENSPKRRDGFYSRNNDVENRGSGRTKFGGHKTSHGSNDKHSSKEPSSSENSTGNNRNKGWSSIPQTPHSSFPLENDKIRANGYREHRSESSNGSTSFLEFGESSEVRDRDHFKKNLSHNFNKSVQKGKGSEEHWRRDFNTGRSIFSGKEENFDKDKNCKTNQRERLIDLLSRGILECLVCCEHVHQNASVWSCSNCFHVFHLGCIIKWAKSSISDDGWRCPACQNVTRPVPRSYYCFCGKVRDPEWNRSDCPHSCGEVCGKSQKKACPHKCILLCHPGPCPQCTATVTKSCGCSRTQITVQCCNSDVVTCGTICGKILNCKVHDCLQNCHMDACANCKETIHQDCYCGKENRDVVCSAETAGVEKYSCSKPCGKALSCSNHFCESICHEGECKECDLLPDKVKYCHCGKTKLTSLDVPERTSCKDPIAVCDLTCGKALECGKPGNRHTCQEKCHEGPCPVCPLETVVKCRCGHMDKTLLCSELVTRADDARCSKRCTKRRSCGKHKCNQYCCIDIDHICMLPCNRMLQCNIHRCEETCHRGHCAPCWRASFEELYCECGAEVIYPPVQCGTRKPPCKKPCTRTHNCEHPPTHNCHSASQCPPCTVLTKKYCHGGHELRKAVLCHQDSFSCGLPCNKNLSCGRHKCILLCHEGICLKEGQICTQPCKAPRPVCGHACGAPCHEGPCPTDLQCKEMVKVTCQCGHRYTTRICHDNAKEYHRIATARLASKIADLQAGQTIDLNDVVVDSKKLSLKTLECNDECQLIERNRRLALALQIRNPDLSAKLVPRYSDFMKSWAKKDPRFCETVHGQLTDLVQLAKQSKQKSRSFSFAPMNREKRQFVHEYCEHFGCKSVAYDPEPKRNVVATALREQSWLPSMSLLEVIQRETWPRKVPAPVNVKMDTLPKSQRKMEVLPVKISKNLQSTSNENGTNNPSTSQIDYFDWQPSSS